MSNETNLAGDADRVVKIASAVLPFMASFWGREIGAQMICWLPEDVTLEAIEARIRDRVESYGAVCSDVKACAEAMLEAYRGDAKVIGFASGKSGPAWGLGRGQWIAANGRA